MNSVNITGRLTTDPELRAFPSGESVCKLRLAVEGLAPNRETGYVNASCFGKPGEAAAASKGEPLLRGAARNSTLPMTS